uniref:hypothetical protein n=1 Tax=Pedobacter schmidteae TaxID=2201271 RepID=UPI000EB0D91D|nr:hypothetical protein [Pedobacter schmidteae]
MLSNLTWAQFFAFIGCAAMIYYVFVILRYYPQEIKKIFSKKNTPVQDDEYDFIPDDEFDRVELLARKLTIGFARVSRGDILAHDMLQEELAPFNDIKSDVLRSGINEMVVSEMKKIGTVTSEGEIDTMWRG